jgi:hypothetical protein
MWMGVDTADTLNRGEYTARGGPPLASVEEAA